MLHAQLDEDWKYWMTQYPETATSLGYPGQNARWTDYSPSAIDARAAYLKKSVDRLVAVDRAQLAAGDQLNYDLYRDLLQTAVQGLDFQNDAMPIRGDADFAKFLRTSPRFYFSDAESLLIAYRDIAKRADPELARLFGRLPQTPYGVKPVPQAIAPSQTTAYYETGSFAAGRPANMFANTFKLESRPKWEMETLTMHEAVPGHHIQLSIAQELQGLPEFRKNSGYTAFVEGWGLYAESLGEEMGFYQDAYSKFGRLTYEMWRAIRLVVDTGLHSMGWTREQAVDFFRSNAAKTDQDIIVEIDRYIVWPGQALGYKMGQIKIRELRTDAERTLGPHFDVRAFHDVVLGQGAVPLDVLERQVKAWVERDRKERQP
jgi:uncharacterized protein (DUF885 family)